MGIFSARRCGSLLLCIAIVLALGMMLTAIQRIDIEDGSKGAFLVNKLFNPKAERTQPFIPKQTHRNEAEEQHTHMQVQQTRNIKKEQTNKTEEGHSKEALDLSGAIIKGPEAVSELTKQYALIPISDNVPRVIHIDYYKEATARKSEFPKHSFLFSMHFSYPPFLIPFPNTYDQSDLEEYKRKRYTKEKLAETSKFCSSPESQESELTKQLCSQFTGNEFIYFQHAQTDGTIDILKNVSVKPHECGWMTTPGVVTPLSNFENYDFDKVASFDVPEGCSFQHFMDGVLPKIIQAMPILSDESIKVVLPGCALWKVVKDLLKHIGIHSDRILSPSHMNVRTFYSVCDAPGWHPILWEQMQKILRSDLSVPIQHRLKIAYLQRNKNANNVGRRVRNEQDLMNSLRKVAPNFEIIEFDSSQYPTIDDTINFFKEVRVLIGPHGGAFYNLMYCAPGTILIEFIPTETEFFLFGHMAYMLHQHHWFMRLPGDGVVDTQKVEHILEKALQLS